MYIKNRIANHLASRHSEFRRPDGRAMGGWSQSLRLTLRQAAVQGKVRCRPSLQPPHLILKMGSLLYPAEVTTTCPPEWKFSLPAIPSGL